LTVLTGSECERSDKSRKRFSIKFFAHLIPLAKTRQSSTLMIGFRESTIRRAAFDYPAQR
jgi:hypothetical protein